MKRSIPARLFVFLFLIALFFFYIGIRIAESAWQWTILALMFGLILSFPFVQWHYETTSWPKVKVFIQRSIYVSLGLGSWLFVLSLLRDFTLLVTYLSLGSAHSVLLAQSTKGTAFFTLAAVFAIAGALQAYYGLRIREVKIPIAGLPAALQGFRIVQISDLHAGPSIRKSFIEKVVAKSNALHSDITVLTGDIGDGHVAELRNEVTPLAKLLPTGKIFYVPGNHEYYWNVDDWIKEFSQLGATVLLNRGQKLIHKNHELWIGGVSDPTATLMSPELAPNTEKAMAGGQSAEFKLLLSHRPELARAAAKSGFDLQLSGHTHGGQFFPWTYVAKFFHEHLIGLIQYDKMWLYVSPGTGFWGPPMRIGTIPEITLLILEGA